MQYYLRPTIYASCNAIVNSAVAFEVIVTAVSTTPLPVVIFTAAEVKKNVSTRISTAGIFSERD